MLKLTTLFLLIYNFSAAQDTSSTNHGGNIRHETNFNSESMNGKIYYESLDQEDRAFEKETIEIKFFKPKIRERKSFDFLSAVGSNLSFGGFWDRYAVISFTPRMNIKPFSFIDIYANHNLNCLIPINGVKEYYQSILIQSFAILAIEKSVNLLVKSCSWINDVIGFAAKNLFMALLIKPSIDKSNKTAKPILHFENFYYSLRVSF